MDEQSAELGREEFLPMNRLELRERFIERYGEIPEPVRFFFAPGRINLIGGHTDYTGGLVLPCAIRLGTMAAARRCEENHLALASFDDPFSCAVPLDPPPAPHGSAWVNYPLGVAQQFMRSGVTLPGLGKFACRARPERMVRNPSTGEQMHKDADRVAKVTIAKALKDVINA